jgi:hypothetical protein
MYYLSSWIPFVQTESCQSVVECKSVNTGRQMLGNRQLHLVGPTDAGNPSCVAEGAHESWDRSLLRVVGPDGTPDLPLRCTPFGHH